ncbi:MAG TPA: hypothetical protein VLG50_01245 [Candidatus Saccharimonadales bacterium]|nr:hypothetical protein [Candidatus Saccharimonadales bacterium]
MRNITKKFFGLVLLVGILHANIIEAKISFPPGKITYQTLNADKNNPFVISFGTSISQTHQTCNTVSYDHIRSTLHSVAQKQKDPFSWLEHKDRIWYVLRCLPQTRCNRCAIIFDPSTIQPEKNTRLVKFILKDIATNSSAYKLTMRRCPKCLHKCCLSELPRQQSTLSPAHLQTMIQQINYLNINKQSGCSCLPNYRISLEACDILKDNSTEIDQNKLQAQAAWLKEIGNPMIFLHHYANPESIPHLFEKEEHAQWFAHYCGQVVAASPYITHVCPISQLVAFGFRVKRQTLPPFEISIDQDTYLNNMVKAHIQASKKIKAVNKNIQVLVSHQWKPMKPKHSATDPRGLLERIVCSIANRAYNGKFVSLMQPHFKHFDGIALSIYPAMYFDVTTPLGDNCSGIIDEQSALESIVEIHNAFPGKDIYIAETGCNTANAQTKKDFIDMTLHVCKLARDKGIPVKGIYFWGHTNDPEFYNEWNNAPGSCHFGPFEKLDPAQPFASINAAGKHIQEILS